MTRNIEIKVRIKDVGTAGVMMKRVTAMADCGPVELNQVDTYYYTGAGGGALKLRMLSPTEGHLIHYTRGDTAMTGIHLLQWFLYEAREPIVLARLLERALGISGHVTKRRLLYHSGNVRIHIDDVQGAGWFLELEGVLSQQEPEDAGVSQVLAVIDRLGISTAESIAESYQVLLNPDSLPDAKSIAVREQRSVSRMLMTPSCPDCQGQQRCGFRAEPR